MVFGVDATVVAEALLTGYSAQNIENKQCGTLECIAYPVRSGTRNILVECPFRRDAHPTG